MEITGRSGDHWFKITNSSEIPSPALLVYPGRIKSNIQIMIEMAGNVSRLRPHVKTYKMAGIIRLQMDQGINKFKCATISEAEMTAECGVKDILIAIQQVGPNLKRLFQLMLKYPDAKISCIADCEKVINELSQLAVETGMKTNVWLDINNGMNRTGIPPGEEAIRLIKKITGVPGLKAEGLHVYDGHIHEKDLSKRKKICDELFIPVEKLLDELKLSGIKDLKIVAGGTPTFPVHALRKDVDCSPGTILLWDYGYATSFPDMKFLYAAVLLNRVISKPADDLICIDLGYKAVASEMQQPRITILNLDNYSIIGQSEEHMVIRTKNAGNLNIGDELYSVPWHICPTVDRYENVSVVNNNKVTGQWNVVARKRKISI